MFRPLWVRILVVALALGWAATEFVTGSAGWGMLFLALGAYAGWAFLTAGRKLPPPPGPPPPPPAA